MQNNINQIQDNADTSLKEILSLSDFQKKHADKFTHAQLIWMLRNRKRNKLAGTGAVILAGRKFYINEPLFTQWFANQKA